MKVVLTKPKKPATAIQESNKKLHWALGDLPILSSTLFLITAKTFPRCRFSGAFFFLIEESMAVLILLFLLAASVVVADEDAFIGVNIGTDLSDMPHPTQVVALLKAQQIRHIRLYDADRAMLLALANTGIQVMISVPNEQLLGIGQSNSTAANWVSHNVVAHYPVTNITAISVGSEVLTTIPNAATVLVNALKFIHSALVASNLDRQIKVSTPLSSSIILDSFPPSQAFFNRSWNPVLVPMLNFLQSTVTESGWPSKGDANEPDATLENANTYNSNLIRHVLNKTGTPKHPGIAVSTYIYELYNEDTKAGPVSEKNWGLFDANGSPIYILHLTGSGLVLANDTTNQTYCAVKNGADPKMVQAALDWACGAGKVDCTPLSQGQSCYEPDNVLAHATYAFDSYYHQMGKAPGTCDFKGVAAITTTDPSHGTCIFPGSVGKNGSLMVVLLESIAAFIQSFENVLGGA
ncbi:hypothetical protein CMV_015576 [Castanea mollissima]|uniref:glucan endo-1,3-beta-D-glucosidase n=1 Tax=Castanea mollissima TaxID=60419 RepID=A0A8J4R8X6_9ROSI|nr:hypothetical protein CMV_015576 [Castanea mollissima]